MLGYSKSVNRTFSFDELDEHLYSFPNLPDAVPFAFSYCGFCISHNERKTLPKGDYKAVIDSSFDENSDMCWGEVRLNSYL